MERERFEQLVEKALEELPLEFAEQLDSIDVVVEDWPTSEQLRSVDVHRRQDLLGLYHGVPLTKRGRGLTAKLPDKISIFQKPIERRSRSDAEVVRLVRDVVYHEIAHYFGISDRRLREIERQKRRR
jgi:predicted Zn-dependent protease with MMP-like domain